MWQKAYRGRAGYRAAARCWTILRTFLSFAAATVGLIAASPAVTALPPIGVSDDGHMLVTENAQPFFWLGDTAWEMIHRLTPDETSYYLRKRARQGFTVIQTVVLAEMSGTRSPTPDGLLPFIENDLSRPNEAYFDRVAWVVDEAARHKLYIALLPTWGDKLTAPWGEGPRLFEEPYAARAYGRYLGNRLRGRTNVIWMLGGDRPARLVPNAWFIANAAPAGFSSDHDWTSVWKALAQGLREGSGTRLLTTYHPQAGDQSTSVFLHEVEWLDVNGMQSGHGGGHDVPVWSWIARDYALTPSKPTIDLEPNYEDHPVSPWPVWEPATGRYSDYDVRKQVYRSVLAGAAGVTYGHHAVWQFASGMRPLVNFPDRGWREALHRPGAAQMRHLADLVLSRPYFERVPDPALLASGKGEGASHVVAARARDGSYAVIYIPVGGHRVTVDLERLSGDRLQTWWYDPRTGGALREENIARKGTRVFQSPSNGPDWVLVLDDVSENYRAPGLSLPR